MLIYIKTVSKSVKKWLRIIRLGNLLPRPLAFISHHIPPLMSVIVDDVNTLVLISTIEEMCVDILSSNTSTAPPFRNIRWTKIKHLGEI